MANDKPGILIFPRHKDGENGTDHPVRALAAECDHAAHPIQVFASAE
jgi:hypothetical protein